MNKFLQFFIFTTYCIFLLSCNKEKLKAPTASYIVVNEALVTQNSLGTNTHGITDIWFYVDSKFQGCYPVGSVMPVIAKNNAEIILYGGIKNNGIASTRQPYTFYNSVTNNLAIEPGKTYTLNPTFNYLNNLVYVHNENFEIPGLQFTSVYANGALTSTNTPHLAYGGSGKSFVLKPTDILTEAKLISGIPSNYPVGGSPIYVELDYKCNQKFTVGVEAGGQQDRDAVTVNPQSSWKKIYIQLTGVISTQPTYAFYRVYFKAIKETENAEIYIDNIKVIAQ